MHTSHDLFVQKQTLDFKINDCIVNDASTASVCGNKSNCTFKTGGVLYTNNV